MHQQHRAGAGGSPAPVPVDAAPRPPTDADLGPAPAPHDAPPAGGPGAHGDADGRAVPRWAPVAGPTDADVAPAPASDAAAGAASDPHPTVPPSRADTAARQVDARAAARASLGAGRNPSLWWVCAGLVVVVVVTLTLGAAPGSLVLAGVLGAGALARAVLRPGPVALTVRGRALDTAVLAAFAVAVGVLGQIIPTP